MTSAILAAEPQLFVTDMARSLAFFTGQLGFETVFTYGEPAFYAQVARGGARVNLRQVKGPVSDRDFRARERDALSATVTVETIEHLFGEYETRGAAFHQRLRTERWGARTFIVADPDANLIAFAGQGNP